MRGVSLSSRDYYLGVALCTVRSAELEVMEFFNSLSDLGHVRVRGAIQQETSVTIIRSTIGQTAIPCFMYDFDNVIYPRLKVAVAMWKNHCRQFGTSALVTERTVLDQWVEESMGNLAFVAMRALETVVGRPNYFEKDVHKSLMFNDMFPKIHAWQLLHAR